MSDKKDLVIIGAGPGGYVAAVRAAQLGFKVAIIDKRSTLGGTCLNVGCIPSKALLESSEVFYSTQKHLERHGVKVSGVKLDLPAMMKRKDQVVSTLTTGIAGLMRKNKIETITGSARLIAPGRVEVKSSDGKTQLVEADRILLATGSEPSVVPALPYDGKWVISSTEALCLDPVPENLLIVGGGYIGLELGSVWARLGAKVTVVEFLPRILSIADTEIAQALHKSLEKQGIQFKLSTKVVGAKVPPGNTGKVQVRVQPSQGGDEEILQADKVLVCVGRRAYSAGLGLEALGIPVDPRTGQIPVNEDFETPVKGIYALGDLVAGPMLAHKAEEEGVAFAERLKGHKSIVHHDLVPSVIFTWPEVSSVGPTEEQIKATGKPYKVGKFPFMGNGRARSMDETEGFVKIIADANTDRVLAVHMFGPNVSELIGEMVTVMEFKASSEDIARICHPHPTLSEAVKEAALAVSGRAIHI